MEARKCLEGGQLEELGDLMNINHGLLNGLQLATPELEQLIDAARMGGALGAKLTGGAAAAGPCWRCALKAPARCGNRSRRPARGPSR